MKRHFCALLATLLTLAVASGVAAQTPDARPNIVWIMIDDMSPNMSCYGETTISTPAIDRLAADGVKFNHAFITAPVCSPCRSAVITGMYQTTIGAHNHRSSRGPVKINLPDGVKPLPVLFQEAGYYTVMGGKGKTDYNFEWDAKMYDGADWSGRKPGQPFFAQIQLHGGKQRNAKVANPVNPADVKLPPYYPDHPVLRQDWAEYLNAVINVDNETAKVVKRLEDEKLADNTVLFFFTDHGISHVRDKQFLYDGGMWVPLIVRCPAKFKGGEVRNDLVSLIDVSATSLELAGVPLPKGMEGRPLFGDKAKPREYVVAARDRCDETVDRIRAVRDDRYKYVRNFYPDRSHAQPNFYKDNKQIMVAMRELYAQGKLNEDQARVFLPSRPAEELYDLKNDPYELKNLAADPGMKATLTTMRGRLDSWIRETGDKGQFAESAASLASEEPDYYPVKKPSAGLPGVKQSTEAQAKKKAATAKKDNEK